MASSRRPGTKQRRLRWVLWRVGWVLVLTAFWSSGKFRLSSIWDLAVALIVVAVLSILLYRVKRVYEALKYVGRGVWRDGHRKLARQLARALVHLKD
jgi:di/tricarboxylate transporter